MPEEQILAEILDADVAFFDQPLVKPLVLSSGPIQRLTEARAAVRVRCGNTEALGRGSIYLSDLWAWPDPRYSHEQRDGVLRGLCRRIAADLPDLAGREAQHPLELGLRFHHSVSRLTDPAFATVPLLARSMAASPFDAALHDAAGIALGRSAFDFYRGRPQILSADAMFPGQGAAESIRRILRVQPLRESPAWLVVGKADDLDRDVRPLIAQRGYRCFKLKIMGRDAAADAARTIEVYRAVTRSGARDPRLTIDSNEANPDADSVMDFLDRLRSAHADAYAALQYIEQPTGRDITRSRFDWRSVGMLKPVMLDEGLTDFELLPLAREQGWTGLALKTCKGHSFALVAAAWARRNGMLLSLQDLTNPGHSAIHAGLFGAMVPTINGVELNSPQFTPAANEPWLAKWPGLFDPHEGVHRLPAHLPPGLGSAV